MENPSTQNPQPLLFDTVDINTPEEEDNEIFESAVQVNFNLIGKKRSKKKKKIFFCCVYENFIIFVCNIGDECCYQKNTLRNQFSEFTKEYKSRFCDEVLFNF